MKKGQITKKVQARIKLAKSGYKELFKHLIGNEFFNNVPKKGK